jgi:hypothetical protein
MKPLQVLKKAQVSKSEIARLTGYSRPSVQRWLSEGGGPRGRADGVFFQNILGALERGLKDNALPLPTNLSSATRDEKLRKLVKERIDSDDIQFLIV